MMLKMFIPFEEAVLKVVASAECCCGILLVPVGFALWAICLFITPLLLLCGSLVKHASPDMEDEATVAAGLKILNPACVAELYDWFACSLEAPVSAGHLMMLLILGVRKENGYIITEPVFLYVSLILSLWGGPVS